MGYKEITEEDDKWILPFGDKLFKYNPKALICQKHDKTKPGCDICELNRFMDQIVERYHLLKGDGD